MTDYQLLVSSGNRLYKKVLLGSNVATVTEDDLSDKLRDPDRGARFASQWYASKAYSLLGYISQDRDLSRRFVESDDGETITFSHRSVIQWNTEVDKLVAELAVLLHLTSRQLSQMSGLRVSNGNVAVRNLFIQSRRFVMLIPNHKAKTEFLRQKGIPRFVIRGQR